MRRRPNIALTVTHADTDRCSVPSDYLLSVWKSGGTPIIVPYKADESTIKEIIEFADGFLFCGGDDIDPKYYGEEKDLKIGNICSIRDELEFNVFQKAIISGKPILGICRGIQLINVALGGSLYQHIENHSQSTPRSECNQAISVYKESLIHKITNCEHLKVNSFHHQCVKALGDGLVIDAISSEDGVIEACHHTNHPFLLGVQWHPEGFYDYSETSSKIFDAFITACLKTM